MDCLDTTKGLKINRKRNIGNVLIVVEGAKDEFLLFKQIFGHLLHYNYIEKSRNKEKFRVYEFTSKGNESSRVIVVNSRNSDLYSIEDSDYLDVLYTKLYEDYDIDTKNMNVYYIWDRDCKSNPKKTLYNIIDKFEDYSNGKLLLSYPAIESYIVSCFEKRNVNITENLKKYKSNNNYNIFDITVDSLKRATAVMHKKFKYFNIYSYNLDSFNHVSRMVLDKEEEFFKVNGYYYMLSLVSVILLDLNIITLKD